MESDSKWKRLILMKLPPRGEKTKNRSAEDGSLIGAHIYIQTENAAQKHLNRPKDPQYIGSARIGYAEQ